MTMQTESMFSYLDISNEEEELHYLSDVFASHELNASMGSLVEGGICFTPGCDLLSEGDLFNAPEPIVEDWGVGLDPKTIGIPLMSCGEESSQCEDLLSEVFMDFQKDLFDVGATENPVDGGFDAVVAVPHEMENAMVGDEMFNEGLFSKSLSFDCLDSFEWGNNEEIDSFFDYSGLNFGDGFGMKRSLSEGDMKTLGNDNVSNMQSPPGETQSCSSEERLQKLSRYRNKKKKRNFGRKIKYACRKALADNQPRIRGRFAKTDEHHQRHKKQHVHMVTVVS